MSQTTQHIPGILPLQHFCDGILKGGNMLGINALRDLASTVCFTDEQLLAANPPPPIEKGKAPPKILTGPELRRVKLIRAGHDLDQIYQIEGGRRIFPECVRALTDGSTPELPYQRALRLTRSTFAGLLALPAAAASDSDADEISGVTVHHGGTRPALSVAPSAASSA